MNLPKFLLTATACGLFTVLAACGGGYAANDAAGAAKASGKDGDRTDGIRPCASC